MKKIILVAALLASSTSFSQGVLINTSTDPTDISGTTQVQTVTSAAANLHMFDFLIQNTTGTSQPWMIIRRNMEQPATLWENSFCWGIPGVIGICYPSQNEYSSSEILDVPAGGAGVLNTYLDAAPGSGTALYRYYVTADGINYLDSIDIRVNSSVGTNELEASLNVLVSPNPATDQVTISTEASQNVDANIYDVLGNVIMTTSFVGSKTIDVSDLTAGIYFILVDSEGLKPTTQRIVIQN